MNRERLMKMASAVRTGGKGTVRRWAFSMSHVNYLGSKPSGAAFTSPRPYADMNFHTTCLGSSSVSQRPTRWACSSSCAHRSCSKHHVDL